MIQVRTPTIDRPKKTHSPPSSTNTLSASSKFLKDVTGKGLRKIGAKLNRTPTSQSTATFSPEVEYVQTFSDGPTPNSTKQLKTQFDLLKKRPAPLKLQPLTPPASLKKPVLEESDEDAVARLESPIVLKFDKSTGRESSIYSASLGKQDILSFSSTLFDVPRSSFTLSVDDKPFNMGTYDELESPTCVMQMQRNMRKANGTKKYNSCMCSICDESMQRLLGGGERIVELECKHQCHMECFLAMMDGVTFEPPSCNVCGKKSQPADKQVSLDMVLKKMKESKNGDSTPSATHSNMESSNGEVVMQSLLATNTSNTGATVTMSGISARKLVTPKNQLIHSAQVSTNGFNDVFNMLDEAFDEVSTPTNLICVEPLDFESVPKDELRINIMPKLERYVIHEGSKVIVPHILSTHLPKDDEIEDIKTVQIIMCVSLVNNDPVNISNETFLETLKHRVNTLLENLKPNDTFGLIVVGKDGSGTLGCKSTFYGFITKDWDGWQDIIDGWEVVVASEPVFPNPMWEAKEMLQATHRLLLTTGDPEEAQIRHVVMMNGVQHISKRHYRLEDDIFARKIEVLLEKIMAVHKCSLSQWIDEDEGHPFILRDYAPKWQYRIRTVFFEKLSFDIAKLLKELRRVVVDGVTVKLECAIDKMVKLHSLDFNGKLYRCEGDHRNSLEINLPPFRYGDFKLAIVELEVDVAMVQKHIEQMGSTISLLNYHGSQTGARAESGCVTFQIRHERPTCASPPLSLTTPLFHGNGTGGAADTDAGAGAAGTDSVANAGNTDNNNTVTRSTSAARPRQEDSLERASQYLDLPLVPPSSPSSDSLFVTRHIELMAVESLRKLVVQQDSSSSTTSGTSPEVAIRELTSVVYGMSRECSAMNPQYYEETGHENRLEFYIETLTCRLEDILHHNNPRLMIHKLIQSLA